MRSFAISRIAMSRTQRCSLSPPCRSPIMDPVQSRYSCGAAVVVLEQAAEALAAATGGRLGWRCTHASRKQQQIALALMVSFVVKQLNNATPILEISVKSSTAGIHGMAGQCRCMPISSNGVGR